MKNYTVWIVAALLIVFSNVVFSQNLQIFDHKPIDIRSGEISDLKIIYNNSAPPPPPTTTTSSIVTGYDLKKAKPL